MAQGAGHIHYAFVANEEHKDGMLKVQADGAPTEWIWSCEAGTAEEANRTVTDLMDANDWNL